MIWNNQMAGRILTAAGNFHRSSDTLAGYRRVYIHPDSKADVLEFQASIYVKRRVSPGVFLHPLEVNLVQMDTDGITTMAVSVDVELHDRIHEFD